MKNDIASVSVTIEGRVIGASAPPYIVAEMSGNHNHDLHRALRIIDAAKAAAALASEEAEEALLGAAAAACTSALTMRPAGPVPSTVARFTPLSAAILRASGETLRR